MAPEVVRRGFVVVFTKLAVCLRCLKSLGFPLSLFVIPRVELGSDGQASSAWFGIPAGSMFLFWLFPNSVMELQREIAGGRYNESDPYLLDERIELKEKG